MDNRDQQLRAPVDILIVEDSETQAEYLAHLLSSNGFQVRVARDGRAALALAREARPALIVSDIAMPNMDGFAMCRELKRDAALREVPVILLTVLNSLYDVIKGLDCGADNFIRKPFDGRNLLGRIRFILANRELRGDERVQLGMRINLGGQTHFVTAERQQIFDLLISTYEEAIQMTEELRAQQSRIAHSYQSLEGLYKIAEALNPALTEAKVSEMALERALDLPGVLGGCVKLLDAAGTFHLAAVRDFGTLEARSAECADCSCQRKLAAGELRTPQVIADCALLGAGHAHVSIPLVVGGRTLGVMNLTSSETSFEADDLHVLETVGNQIAIALERAHLYTHMETLVSERTEALQAERNRLSAIVNTTGALVLALDSDGRIADFNPSFELSFGWKLEEVKGRYYWEVYEPPEEVAASRALFDEHILQGVTARAQREWIARDGSRRIIIWSATTLMRPDQTVERVLATGIDVTDLRQAEDKVQYLSNFDVLTGLPNRLLLRHQAHLAAEQAMKSSSVMGLLVISFSRLTEIRQNLSEKTEHALLRQIAERMKSWATRGEGIARFAESSFAVVLVRPTPEDLSTVARQLLALLGEPFVINQQELHMDIGIGIAMCPNDGDDFDLLCQNAEIAMRRAVRSEMERYEFYKPELNLGASERFKLEGALRRALARDEFVLHYQPQVSLGTGKIIGVEALLRWQHPEFGLIAPGRFIGLAEETGLILPIGEWVLRRACEQIREWQRAGVPTVPVAVNLSARQFSSKITDTVREILQQTGLDPKLLELELTESLSMEDPENTFGILRALKDMGVGLAIDDFGTGYSNLNYLKRFPVDRIKLDQSFVRELTSDPDDLAISRAVIVMAHSLRLAVIAEGVETEGQLAVLAQNGCDEMQGYFFSRPVEADICAKHLKEGKSLNVGALLPKPHERAILVVDDEVNLGAAIKRTLRNKGYKVFVTGTTAHAFEMLATERIGVVLCDQRMPGMSGTEFLARVKQMYPGVIRMVLSGYADLQSVTDAVNRGAIFKFLTKPWEDEEFLGAVNDAFRELEGNRNTKRLRTGRGAVR
jgi:PAS domain S-box-containing protein/diguanylate cyclase (GGDEF)-like protein